MFFLLYNSKVKSCKNLNISSALIFNHNNFKINIEQKNNEIIYDSSTTLKESANNNIMKEKEEIELNHLIKEENNNKDLKQLFETANENININQKTIYTCNDIKNILNKNGFPQEIINKINEDSITDKDKQKVYFFETKIKRIRHLNAPEKETRLLGRKKKTDNSERNHDKNKSDNIIKKCKGIFFSNVIDYINEYLNKNKTCTEETVHLLKLDYRQYVNILKKETELKLFNMKLKDLASLQISNKYRSKKDKDFNKMKIIEILEQEKNNEKINMILNITFIEWINIFTFKQKFVHEIEFNGLRNALETIAESNSEEYFSRLIFFLFNYKRWFENRKRRKDYQRNNKLIIENEIF